MKKKVNNYEKLNLNVKIFKEKKSSCLYLKFNKIKKPKEIFKFIQNFTFQKLIL